MTDAPTDRKMARIVRDLAWGNWASKGERAMLLGPRGEVREVFYDNDPSFLAARQALIDSKQLGAVVYLRSLMLEEVLQLSIVEFFNAENKRSAHILMTRIEDKSTWLGISTKDADQWIGKQFKRGGTEKPE